MKENINIENSIKIADRITYNSSYLNETNISEFTQSFINLFEQNLAVRQLITLLNIDIVANVGTLTSKLLRIDFSTPYKEYYQEILDKANQMQPIDSLLIKTELSDFSGLIAPIYINSAYKGCIVAGPIKLKSEGGYIQIDTLEYAIRSVCSNGRHIMRKAAKHIFNNPNIFDNESFYLEKVVRHNDFDDYIKDVYSNYFEYDFVNDKWKCSTPIADLLGINSFYKKNLIGLLALMNKEDRDAAIEYFNALIQCGNEKFVKEIKFKNITNNQIVWLEIKGSLITDSEGEILKIFGSATDVTLHKENENQLKLQIDNQKKFLSIIAHDLKNPFNALLGFCELIKNSAEQKNYNDTLEYASIIKAAATQGYDLLVNLLDYSRTETGRISMHKEIIPINQQIESIFSLCGGMALRKKITLINATSPTTTIYGDQYMTSTILRNLISNAIKFCFKSGKVIVSTNEENNGFTRISVTDTGIKIDQETIDKILHSNANFSTHGTYDETGTGLGLKIVIKFLAYHNSKLEIESNNEQTTFSYLINSCQI